MKPREQALLLLRKAEDYDAVVSLDRRAARESLRAVRVWVESILRERPGH
jgi:hypothetical protein